MLSFWKPYKISILFLCIGVVLYGYFAYLLERTEFLKVLSLWIVLFFISYQLIERNHKNIKSLAVIALIFRLIILCSIPNLSQDFYRFIWDGRMLLEGFNPYLSLPETWIKMGNSPIVQGQTLYKGMGVLNASHYTNYPPISQLCYYIAALFAGKSVLGSVIVLRTIMILADVGIFFFGIKLLRALHLPEYRIFWYILNPFIIIELTGNLHFEAVMIFFIVFSLYLLHKGYWYWAAIMLGLSISVKLIPLLFLPLLFQKLIFPVPQNRNIVQKLYFLVAFYGVALGTVFITFLPFLSRAFISNFKQTIGLWFQNFEFNAGIYFVIRWIGYKTIGWNIIETVGKILPIIVIAILIALTFFRKNKTTIQLITAMLIGICCYYFLSTTVHPWYIAVPLSLCIFTKYKFPIWWSLVVILSYTAYRNPEFKENLWMVGLEYTVVFSVFLWEIFETHQKVRHD